MHVKKKSLPFLPHMYKWNNSKLTEISGWRRNIFWIYSWANFKLDILKYYVLLYTRCIWIPLCCCFFTWNESQISVFLWKPKSVHTSNKFRISSNVDRIKGYLIELTVKKHFFSLSICFIFLDFYHLHLSKHIKTIITIILQTVENKGVHNVVSSLSDT